MTITGIAEGQRPSSSSAHACPNERGFGGGSTRLLMLKDDGSVLVHADAGGYKPLNSDLPG